MKKILQITLLAATLLAATRVPAASPGTISTSWSGSQAIPDNNASGVAFFFILDTGVPGAITDVTVDLNIAGGWNGDLYAYLSHGSGSAVLLNRVGRFAGNPDGAGSSGFSVTLSDSYLTDIHNAGGSPLVGNFAPDGRSADPFNVLDTDPRNAPLGNLAGLDPNGSWTLFFADLSPVNTSTIQSWTVNVSSVVPEPGSATLLALAFLSGLARRAARPR
jgi:subtilisin-like proprotein convertase family protein